MVKLDQIPLMLQLKNMFLLLKERWKIVVTVSSVEHPMTKEHYIEWIAVVSDNGIERLNFHLKMNQKLLFVTR